MKKRNLKVKTVGRSLFHKTGTLALGVTILSILIYLNIFSHLNGENLIKQGPGGLPPQISLFQDLLYTPQVSQYLIETDEWASGWGDSEIRSQLDRDDILLLKNTPLITQQIGKTYSFRPEIGLQDYNEFTLNEAPEGMSVQDGEITWIPDENQVGENNIALRLSDSDGLEYEAVYSVIVTEEFFPLGTNRRGQSLSGLIVAGSKWTIVPGLIAASIAIFIGGFMGAVSAYHKDQLDSVLSYIADTTESVPALIIVFLIAAATQFNVYYIMIGVGIVLLPSVQNIIRSNTLQFVENQFVESSSEIGFKDRIILWREIIWYNCKSDLISLATYCFAFSILIEVTISYLGLGVQIPDISWGVLLAEGRSSLLREEYWMTVFPALAITASILGFIFLGAGLKQKFDPKLK